MSVVPFQRPKQRPPEEANEAFHGRGEAFCTGCKHTWEAVVNVGTTLFECPSCGATKGRWKFSYYPPEGHMVRECNCGNRLFYLTPDGHQCAECGTYQRY